MRVDQKLRNKSGLCGEIVLQTAVCFQGQELTFSLKIKVAAFTKCNDAQMFSPVPNALYFKSVNDTMWSYFYVRN